MKINLLGIKFAISKYNLLRFMNKKHSIYSRYFFALIGFLGTILITRSLALARLSYNDFHEDKFKISFRRSAKLIFYYTGRRICRDDTFNFCEEMSDGALVETSKRFEKIIRNNGQKINILGDYLYICAGLIEKKIPEEKENIRKFNRAAQQILTVVGNIHGDKLEKIRKHYYPVNRLPAFNIKHAFETLSDWSALFPIDELEWFVISGTFLGLVRDKGFLKHDYDIDIGIKEEKLNLKLITERISSSKLFFIKKIDWLREGSFQNGRYIRDVNKKVMLIKIIHKTGLNIDLFIHYTQGNICWHGSSFHRWDNTDFLLKKYKLFGIDVYGPIDAELYLTENYGEWRTPVTNFHFNTGTPNLTIVKNPSSIAMFLKRISEIRSPKSYLKIEIFLRELVVFQKKVILILV